MGTTFVILAILGGAAFWVIRNRKPAPAGTPRTHRTPQPDAAHSNKFASVVLHCAGGSCEAALQLKDRQLLAAEAPSLPLAGCDRSACGCSWVKAGDRRQLEEGRRTADVGISPLIYDGEELRTHRDDRRNH